MLHKATSIEESSSLRGDFLRYMERKSNNDRTTIWVQFYIAWQMLIYIFKFFGIQSCFKEILIFGETLTTLSHSLNTGPHPLLSQASRNQLYAFMWVHTDTTLPTWAHPHPPSFKQPLLLCSPQLGSAFLRKEPDWGLGVFCGPNKRAKVVRTPLYKSVGGGGQWPKQLVFQAWAYTDQQAWAVAWQQ